MTTVELWTDLACNSGAPVGELIVVAGQYSDQLDNTDAISLTIQHDARVAVELRYVLRVTDGGGVVREYRIQARGRTLANGQRTVKGISVLADLAASGLVRTVTGGATTYDIGGRYTPTEFVDTFVLANLSADGLSWLARGTIDFTAYETITAPNTGWTRLEWLRQIANKTGGELRLRRNGSTSYLIDLVTQVGSAAAAVPIALGKNLLALQEDIDDGELATAITVQGSTETGATAPASIGENAWVLGTIPGSGYWIPLTDPGGGAGPVAFASQFGTAAGSQAAYLLRSDGGTTQITDSRITPDNAVLVAAATGLTAGHHVQLVADASATRLTELRAPGVKRLHRVDTLADARGERNLLRNGLLLNWTDAFTPQLWTAQGGTMEVGEYRRAELATHSGIVVNGAHSAGAGGIAFRNAPANARFYSNEYFVVGAAPYRVGNIVAEANGSGAGSIVFASGTLPSPLADGDPITFFGAEPTRPSPSGYPTERDANNLMRMLSAGGGAAPPSATQVRMQSEAFTVKYLAGELAQLNASAACTCVNGTGATVGNLDSGPAITESLAAAVTRILPGMMIRNQTGPARLAWSAMAASLAAGATRHETITCSATLSADTTVDVCLLGTATSLFSAFRWVTLWLGPTSGVEPYPGSWGNRLWQRGNRALLARTLGSRQLRVSLVDLSAAAGYSITREQLVLGGTIPLEDLGVSVRSVGIVYSVENPLDVDVLLDSRPTRLTTFLAERL